MSVVILCEKREQGEKVGAGLGLRQGRNCYEGTYNGSKTTVVWAAGHLLRLQTPEEVKADVSWDDIKSLLPLPIPERKVPTDRGRKYLPAIGAVLRDASEVWIGTDPDREGEAIGRDILAHHGYRGKVQRMWMTGSLEPKDIKRYASNLLPGHQHIPDYRAQEARNRSDWLWQLLVMAYTRAARLGVLGEELSRGRGKAGVASLGRVQTTTLWFVVERDRLIRSFVPTDHFRLAVLANGLPLDYSPISLPDGKMPGLIVPDSGKPLFTDLERMKAFAGRIRDCGKLTVTKADYGEKKKNPPLPHNLDSLQTSMLKLEGLTSAEALKIADKLRLDGYLTYPRTEHREVPMSLYNESDLKAILGSCSKLPGLEKPSSEMMQEHPGERTPACFSNKPMEHHGIIPTEKAPNFAALSASERAVYFECCKAFVIAMFPAATYKTLTMASITSVADAIENPESQFTGTFRSLQSPGWLLVEEGLSESKQEQEEEEEEEEQQEESKKSGESEVATLPQITNGSVLDITKIALRKAVTKKPGRFTESTLRAAMKNAGRFAEGDNAKVLRSVKGIGTPATRHSIIETLLDRVYLTRKGKGTRARLESTPKAEALMQNISPDLRNVNNTAHWETLLREITETRDLDEASNLRDTFVGEQVAFLEKHITAISTSVESHVQEHGNERKYEGEPTKKMLSLARKLAKQNGKKLPGNAKSSFSACKEFIDSQISNGGNRQSERKAPTPKMISYIKRLAKTRKVELTDELESFASAKAFLDKYAAPRQKKAE